MLRIYGTMLEMVREMRPTIDAIAKCDASLGDQLRRAVQSVVLNTAEAEGSRGRNQQVRFSSALGSMRETVACVDVGAVLGYVEEPSEAMVRRFEHVIAVLVKLAR